MKLEWMHCFVEIAATGSLNKAADNLYLTQPAVSKMMQALEKELGVTLLLRRKTGVSLTEHGELFLRYAKTILHSYEAYLADRALLQNQQADYNGTLELVVSSSLLQIYYKPIKSQLKKAFPRTRIAFVEADVLAAAQLLANAPHRLAIVSFSDEMKATLDSPIIIETIYQSHLVCCVNKDSPLSSTSYPLIESTLDPAVLIQIQFAKSNFGFVIDDICNMRTTNLNMIRTAILSDDNACVLMPQCIIEKLFQADEISQLPIMPQRLIGFGLMYHQEALNKGYFTNAFFKQFKRELKMVLTH